MRFFLLFLFFVCSCVTQAQGGIAQLRGRVENLPVAHSVTVTCVSNGRLWQDSTVLNEPSYLFNCPIDEPMMGLLTFSCILPMSGENGSPEVRLNVPVFLQRGTIQVLTRDSVANTTVTGSEAHADYELLRLRMKAFDARYRALFDSMASARLSGDAAATRKVLRARYLLDTLVAEAVYASFITEKPASPLAGWALQRYTAFSYLQPARALRLLDTLPRSMRHNRSMDMLRKALKEEVEGLRMPMRDFASDDPWGNRVTLSSFQGKWVLVDFWASWCVPCRMENPNLRDAVRLFGDKGFTILGVSLDYPNGRDQWIRAIQDDGLDWPQVSELAGFQGYLPRHLNIRSIPANYLLSPAGFPVLRNLRGQQLLVALAGVLGE